MSLPKPTSWLNPLAIAFGRIRRQGMRRGNVTAVTDLKEKRLRFSAEGNAVFAEPLRGSCTGRP